MHRISAHLLLTIDQFHQVNHTIGEAALIIIPGKHFYQISVLNLGT
jgi:hypothetical protein